MNNFLNRKVLPFLLINLFLGLGNFPTKTISGSDNGGLYLPVIANKLNEFHRSKQLEIGELITGQIYERVFLSVDLTAGQVYNARLSFDSRNTDLNFHVYDRPEFETEDNQSVIAKSLPSNASKDVAFYVAQSGKYYIVISLYRGEKNKLQNFEFSINSVDIHISDKPKSDFDNAAFIEINSYILSNLGESNSFDYYKIWLQKGKTYKAQISFHKTDLDLEGYYPDQRMFIGSFGADRNNEQIFFRTKEDGFYYMRVEFFAAIFPGVNSSKYILKITEDLPPFPASTTTTSASGMCIIYDCFEPNDSSRNAKPISINQRVVAFVNSTEDTTDFYSIQLKHNRFYMIELVPFDSADLDLTIFHEDFVVANAYHRDSVSEQIFMTAEADRIHYIGVYYISSLNSSRQQYQLIVTEK